MSNAEAKPQGCTNFKLRQLVRRVSQLYDAEVAKAGLKTTQYSLLSHVLRLGPIRPGDLAQAMTMDASTLTRNLKPHGRCRLAGAVGRAKTGAAAASASRRPAATSAPRRSATGRRRRKR